MPSKTLCIMVGLPRSGKSTTAKQTGFPIVSVDAIQYAMCGKHMKPLYEFHEMSDTYAKYMIKSLFLAGHDDVVYDACNHLESRRDYWANWCNEHAYGYVFTLVDTPMEVCQDRAKGFKNADWLIPRIEEMAFEFDEVK